MVCVRSGQSLCTENLYTGRSPFLDSHREDGGGLALELLALVELEPPVPPRVFPLLHAYMKVDIRLSGKWEFKLPWRKAGLIKSSR